MSRVVAQFSTAMCLVLALAWSVGAQSSPDYAPTLLKAAAPLPGANGVAFDARDDLWVGSAGGTITQIDKESGDILQIFGPGPRWGADDGRLVEIMAGGKVREVSPAGLISGGGGIAAMPAEDGTTIVYVPDIFGFHAVAGETGTEVPTESGQPYAAMTAGALGPDVVTSSWFMGTLQLWDPVAGEVVADLSGSLTGPALNAIGFGDHAIFSELGADGPAVVSVDSATGERALVASMGMPSGLATDGSDLCVADCIAGTVAQVIDDGAIIEPLVVATGLALPEGLAMIDAGSLAVAEAAPAASRESTSIRARRRRSSRARSRSARPRAHAADRDPRRRRHRRGGVHLRRDRRRRCSLRPLAPPRARPGRGGFWTIVDRTSPHPGRRCARKAAAPGLLHYTRSMPSLREYLDAPQFTSPDGESYGESVVGRVGGNWVKSGEPRWKAYLFYLICLGGGIGLIVTGGGELDLFAMFGVLCLALGVLGGIETIRGKPFTRIFGGPTKPSDPTDPK